MVKGSLTNLWNRLLENRRSLLHKTFPRRQTSMLPRQHKKQRKKEKQRYKKSKTRKERPFPWCHACGQLLSRCHRQALPRLRWVLGSFKPHWSVLITWPVPFQFTRMLFLASSQHAVLLRSSSHKTKNDADWAINYDVILFLTCFVCQEIEIITST